MSLHSLIIQQTLSHSLCVGIFRALRTNKLQKIALRDCHMFAQFKKIKENTNVANESNASKSNQKRKQDINADEV